MPPTGGTTVFTVLPPGMAFPAPMPIPGVPTGRTPGVRIAGVPAPVGIRTLVPAGVLEIPPLPNVTPRLGSRMVTVFVLPDGATAPLGPVKPGPRLLTVSVDVAEVSALVNAVPVLSTGMEPGMNVGVFLEPGVPFGNRVPVVLVKAVLLVAPLPEPYIPC